MNNLYLFPTHPTHSHLHTNLGGGGGGNPLCACSLISGSFPLEDSLTCATLTFAVEIWGQGLHSSRRRCNAVSFQRLTAIILKINTSCCFSNTIGEQFWIQLKWKIVFISWNHLELGTYLAYKMKHFHFLSAHPSKPQNFGWVSWEYPGWVEQLIICQTKLIWVILSRSSRLHRFMDKLRAEHVSCKVIWTTFIPSIVWMEFSQALFFEYYTRIRSRK